MRRLVGMHGVGLVVACTLGAVLVLAGADYLIRFQDQGIRLICSLLLLAIVVWSCYRYLYQSLGVKLRDVDLALHLQRRFPELDDRLASSVEFLRQDEDDPLAGSASLRRAVVAQTTAETERLDFSDVFDRRSAFRAAMAGVAVLLLATIVVVAAPNMASIGVARLVNPLSDATWPQETHLKVQNAVLRVARGRAFEVEVVDAAGKRLPEEVRIDYRFTDVDGTITRETKVMLPLGESVVFRRENVMRSFSYRVEGGDDNTMPWVDVEVLEPPTVKSLSLELIPPSYTAWPKEKAEKDIRAIRGTQLTVTAKSNKPLSSAVMHLGEKAYPVWLSEDGLRLELPGPSGGSPISIEKSGPYWFELIDRDGLSGDSKRWGVEVVADNRPTVAIEKPSGELFITPRAMVPLRVAAKDDLAIREITLSLHASGFTTDQPSRKPSTLLLFEGPEKLSPQPARLLWGAAELGQREVVEYRWELEPLQLQAGMQVDLLATVVDYCKQTGQSQSVRLVVITPEQLQQRVGGRQSLILAELARVLKMQRTSRGKVAALEIRLQETGRFERLDVDRLQAAELSQRRINSELAGTGEGVSKQIKELLQELTNNKLDSPDVQRRMQGLLDEIERLNREHLSLIDRGLNAAIKSARIGLAEADGQQVEAATTKASISQALTLGGKHQDAVIASLEKMLGRLSQWDNYRRFYREVSQLLRDQEELTDRASELAADTLGKELKDLLPRKLADLKVSSSRQLELARRLDRIQQEMQHSADQLLQSDPLAAATLGDALAEARRLSIGGRMRDCGGCLVRNQMGQAALLQKQIAEDLREVLDILANRKQHELARLVKKLKEAETELAELDKRQEGLRKKIKEAGAEPNNESKKKQLKRLERQQRQLREETEQMARRLQRLLADKASQSAAQAAGEMAAAADATASDATKAADRANRAGKLLQETRRRLAQRRLRAQTELAMEQFGRLEDSLKHLYRRQEKVVQETLRLETLKREAGRLSRAQTASLDQLTREEEALRDETLSAAEKFAGSAAFNFALSGAAREMSRAAALLARRDTGPDTQTAEQNALARLQLLLKAVEPEEPKDDDSNNAGGGAGDGQGEMPAGAVQTLAEIKLLKLMQEEINLRTTQFPEDVKPEDLSPQQRREYNTVSEDQGRLAELILQLLGTQANPEDDPDSLPDMRIE